MWERWRRSVFLLLSTVLLLTTTAACLGPSYSTPGWEGTKNPLDEGNSELLASVSDKQQNSDAGWIVKWKQGEAHDPLVISNSVVLSEQESVDISVMKPSEGMTLEAWMQLLHDSKAVQYVEPNQQVQTLAVPLQPNDEHYNRQYYLKQTGVHKAWSEVNNNSHITVAFIDTGVDLNHPDLKPNLVKGINLLQDGPPQDDNGHGTNVAGVIGAVGNNQKGVAGVNWNTKLMPIKALDSRGYGDEDKLGAGILYAVDNGAKIVVMSVGLYRYSQYMQDIVDYAERKGVLLIAATGNDGSKLQERAVVKYPAAYPTVLAVGGVTPLNRVESRSNHGPEVDLVAPWHVYTTAVGGGTREQEGTSMAAPQVAGVASLLWTKYPELKPYQIREHLRMTAEDVESPGWDSLSGYGLLRADRALQVKIQHEGGAGNATKERARLFPIDTSRSGYLDDKQSNDWYLVDVPYDGVLELKLERIAGKGTVEVRHEHVPSQKVRTYKGINKSLKLPVQKGKQYIRIRLEHATPGQPFTYKIASRFIIFEDPFEPNDEQYKAHVLPARHQQITGTFSHTKDSDWYRIQINTKSTLKLKVSTTTARIDPLVTVKSSEWKQAQFFDEYREGETETVTLNDLAPGKYDIQIQNAVTDRSEPASGLYKLDIEVLPQYSDPNEPNNKIYEAVAIVPEHDYLGVIHTDDDEDWFQFKVDKQMYASISVNQIPKGRKLDVSLQTKKKKKLSGARNALGDTKLTVGAKLDPGTYYVQIKSNASFNHQPYKLHLKLDNLVGGFRDIAGHWAEKEIETAVNKKWIKGYDDARFQPNQMMTRAEISTIVANAFELAEVSSGNSNLKYRDVPREHWAFHSISRVVEAGIAAGTDAKQFNPNRHVTRAELAVMIGKALRLKPSAIEDKPFQDVEVVHWAAPMLAEMKRSGYIEGYKDSTFAPNRKATRAECVKLLQGALLA